MGAASSQKIRQRLHDGPESRGCPRDGKAGANPGTDFPGLGGFELKPEPEELAFTQQHFPSQLVVLQRSVSKHDRSFRISPNVPEKAVPLLNRARNERQATAIPTR